MTIVVQNQRTPQQIRDSLRTGPSTTTRYLDESVMRWVDNLVADEPELDVALGAGEVVDFEGNLDV